MTDATQEIQTDVQLYKNLEQRYKEEFHTSPSINYYIISSQWLSTWKRIKGYDGEEPTNETLKPINGDIGIKPKTVIKYEPLEQHMWNTCVKEGLEEGQDYEIISEEMWNFLKKNQKVDFTICRDSYINKENKKVVNVILMKLKFAPVFPSLIHKFKGGNKSSLLDGDQYVARTTTLKKYVELLERTLPTVTQYNFLKNNSVRLYRCPAEWSYDDLTKHISDEMKDLQSSDTTAFKFAEADYLDPELIDTMEDCKIEPNQILVMDAKETNKTWVIKCPIFMDEGKCESCYQFKVLTIICECKKVSYCSEQCKEKDEFYHAPKCEKQDSDEEKINALSRIENSRNGVVGLRNLGNTCFMNSGIHCISNTWELTDFILTNEFKKEINELNPLGSKGVLVTKFSNLLKKLWFDTKISLAPFSFKKIIGELQPQFQGYQQHDGQELITFLLDGIHEDLNRIKVKPYLENPDGNGRSDQEIAKESWDLYKKRNDSVIIDNMQGMYRSQLQCPTCKKISITFDPYLMVNVAIPQDTRKVLKVQIVNTQQIWDSNEEVFHYDKSKNLKFKDVIDEKGKEWLDAHVDQIVLTCSSTYNTEDGLLFFVFLVFVDEMLHFLKKKLKYRKLFIRKLSQQEQNVPLDSRVIILVHNSYNQGGTYSWKKDLLEPQNFIFSRQVTYQGIHLELFKAHMNILKDFPEFDPIWLNQTDEELLVTYKNHVIDKLWVVEFKTNQKYNVPCSFCIKDSCNDCPIPFDDTIELNVSLERGEKLMQCEFYIVWKIPFRQKGQLEDIYNDWKRHHVISQNSDGSEIITAAEASSVAQSAAQQSYNGQIYLPAGAIPLPAGPSDMMLYESPSEKSQKVQKQFTLQECLIFSTKPEQLEEDNTWYCSNCKDHVQAFKTMQIYVAPKILIFHFKRFKASPNKTFKSKLDTLVEFPLHGLDMKDFLFESRIPQQFDSDPKAIYSTLYDLYAVCNHFGGLGGGHYTAYCKNHYDNLWYNYDDQKVTEVKDLRQIVGPQAYVLFYRKRDIGQK